MRRMLDAAARWSSVSESAIAREARENAEKNKKKYGIRRPHGHYPTDVVTVGGTDYALLPVSRTVYRIRWHERRDPHKDTSTFVPQFYTASHAETQAVLAKKGWTP